MPQAIDRASPIPYYEQLSDILRARIVSGDFPQGERLPSEHELCRTFGLSRATVRQTLSKLESEGYAHRIARRGVFASAPDPTPGWSVQDAEGFLELQLRHGRSGVQTTVISARQTTPPAHVAEALQLTAGEHVFALERVRSMDGVLAMFSTNWLPGAAGTAIERDAGVVRGVGSVNSTLRKSGFITAGARRVVESLAAPDRIAAHLEIDPGRPILRVRSLSWNHDNVRFDYYETWVLTDVVPLEVNVTAS